VATTETTAAPVATTASTSAPTSTTFPPTLAAPTSRPPAPSETTAPVAKANPDPETSEDAAALRGRDTDSGSGLPETLAIVLIPTLAGLALGAKLRQSKSQDAEPA
jgi:hypothetical protein